MDLRRLKGKTGGSRQGRRLSFFVFSPDLSSRGFLGLEMANERLGSETRVGRESSGRTVTRADLSEIVYQKVGLSRTESAELVQSVLDEICDAAARGETVKLSGFGSFVVRSKGERVGRNPKTGVEVPILPRRVMVFKPSNVLKAKINGRDPPAGKD